MFVRHDFADVHQTQPNSCGLNLLCISVALLPHVKRSFGNDRQQMQNFKQIASRPKPWCKYSMLLRPQQLRLYNSVTYKACRQNSGKQCKGNGEEEGQGGLEGGGEGTPRLL